MSAGLRDERREERGIALLIVLLAITLLTIVVVEFTQSAQVETHFALSSRNGLQAFYLARSGVNVGEALIAADKNGIDSDDDVWARPLPALPIGDGTVALRVEDEGRRLNLNMLRKGIGPTRASRQILERLFRNLNIDLRVLAEIDDWIDDDSDAGVDPPGAEQHDYFGLTPPVVVRNKPMLTMGELRQVRSMTPALFAQLEEFVTVLPVDSVKVNVNTARAQVLYALAWRATENGPVERLIAARQEEPILSVDTGLRAVPDFDEALGNHDFVDTKSTYFRIDAVGQVNDVVRGISTIVNRDSTSRTRLKRITWTPSTADLSLTSQSPSDFLDSLPPLRGN